MRPNDLIGRILLSRTGVIYTYTSDRGHAICQRYDHVMNSASRHATYKMQWENEGAEELI